MTTLNIADRKEIGNPTDIPIASDLPGLAEQIARETMMFNVGPGAFTLDADWDRVWELRARMADTRSHNLNDLRAKAMVIAGEMQRDEDALTGDILAGSVASVVASLLYDLMSLRSLDA